MFFFSIFFNQLITAVVLFHCCSCNLFRNSLLMFSRITLLIILISFFPGLISHAVALFSKFGLWSFNIMKHSSLSLIWILSRMFFLLAIFLPSSLMLLVILEFAFFVGLDNREVTRISFRLFYKKWMSY